MNILIVAPRVSTRQMAYNFPLGLAYISAVLKARGIGKVHCINLNHQEDNDEVVITRAIQKNNIDVFCTGGMSTHWGAIEPLFKHARSAKGDIISIAGGPLVTSEPELAILNLDFDIGVIGEGEETICELVTNLSQNKDICDIRGIIYRGKDKSVVCTPERPTIEDLDTLPLPDYEGFELEKLLGWMTDQNDSLNIPYTIRLAEIITSRSCPFQCTFCYHPLGNKYRQRTLDNTFLEIELLVRKYGVNVINVSDELFSDKPDRILEFTRRIKEFNIRWIAQWRAPNISPTIIKQLKDSGILFVAIGLESPCDNILESMKKRIKRKDIERALLLASQGGVWTRSNIILGDVADTVESMEESIQWWLSHPEYDINLGFIMAIPKSPLYIQALERGLIKDRLCHIKEGFPVVNLSKASAWDFNKIFSKVYYLNATDGRSKQGQVITTLQDKEKSTKQNRTYHLKTLCPYCGVAQEHAISRRRFEKPLKHISLQCRACSARYKISAKSAFPGEYSPLLSGIYHLVILATCFLMRFPSFRRYNKAWTARIFQIVRWARNLHSAGFKTLTEK